MDVIGPRLKTDAAPAPTLRSNRVTPSQIRDIFTFGHDQLSDSKEIFYACKSCINQAYRETISVSSPVCGKKSVLKNVSMNME